MVASALVLFPRAAHATGPPACYSPQVAALDQILNTRYQHLSSALTRKMSVDKGSIVSSPYLHSCLSPSRPSIPHPHPLSSAARFAPVGCLEFRLRIAVLFIPDIAGECEHVCLQLLCLLIVVFLSLRRNSFVAVNSAFVHS